MKGLRLVVLGLVLASIIASGRLVVQSLDELVQRAMEAKNVGNTVKVNR